MRKRRCGIGSFAHDLIGESIHQEHPGILLSDAALAKVEHRLLVELTGGGAMAAFYIIV